MSCLCVYEYICRISLFHHIISSRCLISRVGHLWFRVFFRPPISRRVSVDATRELESRWGTAGPHVRLSTLGSDVRIDVAHARPQWRRDFGPEGGKEMSRVAELISAEFRAAFVVAACELPCCRQRDAVFRRVRCGVRFVA